MRFAPWLPAVLLASATTLLVLAQQRPTTNPVVVENNKVLILPFQSVTGVAGNYDWIGRGLQQNLLTELGRLKTLSLVPTSSSNPAFDEKTALTAARSAGADRVVLGSFQLLDQDLRINGQILDVPTGQTLGTLKSTGTVRDLFAMEDTIATQVRRILVPPIYHPASLPLAIPAPAIQPAPAPVVPPSVANSYAADYDRYVYYPSNYGYGYGYGYGGYSNFGYAGSYGYSSYYPSIVIGRTFHQPIGVGANGSMVAAGMISVTGNFRSNGLLGR